MTYSDEKAELVRTEFFKRLKVAERTRGRKLRAPEKEELLSGVQAVLEERYRAEREEQKRRRQNRLQVTRY